MSVCTRGHPLGYASRDDRRAWAGSWHVGSRCRLWRWRAGSQPGLSSPTQWSGCWRRLEPRAIRSRAGSSRKRRRGSDFREGDIRELPFDQVEFDVVRSERVFQYLDPSEAPRAAAELLRVTKPGGIVQIVDPDHLQTAITATDRELAHLLTQQFTLISKSPESGLYLGGLLREAGAEDVRLELWPATFTTANDFRAVRDLKSELAYLEARHLADAERAAAFMADLEARDRAGTFLSTIITYSATGRKV